MSGSKWGVAVTVAIVGLIAPCSFGGGERSWEITWANRSAAREQVRRLTEALSDASGARPNSDTLEYAARTVRESRDELDALPERRRDSMQRLKLAEANAADACQRLKNLCGPTAENVHVGGQACELRCKATQDLCVNRGIVDAENAALKSYDVQQTWNQCLLTLVGPRLGPAAVDKKDEKGNALAADQWLDEVESVVKRLHEDMEHYRRQCIHTRTGVVQRVHTIEDALRVAKQNNAVIVCVGTQEHCPLCVDLVQKTIPSLSPGLLKGLVLYEIDVTLPRGPANELIQKLRAKLPAGAHLPWVGVFDTDLSLMDQFAATANENAVLAVLQRVWEMRRAAAPDKSEESVEKDATPQKN